MNEVHVNHLVSNCQLLIELRFTHFSVSKNLSLNNKILVTTCKLQVMKYFSSIMYSN